MDRKKFITGLMALGTLPAGTLLLPMQAAAQPNGAPDAKDKPEAERAPFERAVEVARARVEALGSDATH